MLDVINILLLFTISFYSSSSRVKYRCHELHTKCFHKARSFFGAGMNSSKVSCVADRTYFPETFILLNRESFSDRNEEEDDVGTTKSFQGTNESRRT